MLVVSLIEAKGVKHADVRCREGIGKLRGFQVSHSPEIVAHRTLRLLAELGPPEVRGEQVSDARLFLEFALNAEKRRGLDERRVLLIHGGPDEREGAGAFVHELGHDLGFGHGGLDDNNCKPNYFSIMNYLYAEDGLTVNGQPGVIDYSRFEAGDLDENDLDEPAGIPLGNATFAELSSYRLRVSRTANYPCGNKEWISMAATDPADWNDDGDSSDLNLQVELQGDAPGENIQFGVIRAQDDWSNLAFMTNDIGSALPGAPMARMSMPETARDVLRSALRQLYDTISNGGRSGQAVDLSSHTFDELVRRQLYAFRNNATLYRPTGTHTCTW